jgi:hypothetical protein
LLPTIGRAKMAIDEQRVRQSLHTKLADALGSDEAALLMDYLPPVGWADVAAKRDLDALAVATKRDLEALGTALRSEMAATRSDLHAEITDLKSTLLMWLVPTVIGSIAGAVTLSRVL